jgi:S-adenosyl methyltransferase
MDEGAFVVRETPAAQGRPRQPSRVDTTVAHPARMHNYVLGGKDNFAIDREVAEKRLRVFPDWRTSARENRAFLVRAVRFLVGSAGVRQFLDIGTGLPVANNVHEVAQALDPACRVVYADNDPIVMAHARALLASTSVGRTDYVEADLRHPEQILSSRAVQATLDFGKPVALMLLAVLHFISDEDDPYRVVGTLMDALPAGSYLVISHPTPDHDPVRVAESARVGKDAGVPVRLRTLEEFEGFFAGLDVIEPDAVLVSEWRPDGDGPRPMAAEVNCYGAVARKP